MEDINQYLRDLTSKTVGNITTIYSLSVKHGDEALKEQDPYIAMVKKLCGIEENALRSKSYLDKARNAQSIAEFDEIYDTENNKTRRSTINTSETMQRFMGFLEATNNEAVENMDMASTSATTAPAQQSIDEDLMMTMDDNVPEFDPITKLRLTDPIRNKICKHIYGKSSIEKSLKINHRLRCPILGCNNQKRVEMTDLYEDINITQIVKNRLERLI